MSIKPNVDCEDYNETDKEPHAIKIRGIFLGSLKVFSRLSGKE